MGLFNLLSSFGIHGLPNDELIKQGAAENMTDREFIVSELTEWLHSPQRAEMIKAHNYYHYRFGLGKPEVHKDSDGMIIANFPKREHVVRNVFADLVDQKVNYIAGKPFTLQCENKTVVERLTDEVFNYEFDKIERRLATDCFIGGIAWLHPFFTPDGLSFAEFPSFEILPFWLDDMHTILDLAVRYYKTEKYEEKIKKEVEHVEVFSNRGIERYILDGGRLLDDEDAPFAPYAVNGDTGMGWEKIPLVAFKYNAHEIPLLRRVEELQDSLNKFWSTWTKDATEDLRDAIFVLTNYDGENLETFRSDLMRYGAIKLRDDGAINLLKIERDTEAYVQYQKELKKALIESGRGFDAKDERIGSNPNEMNLKSMYADIDLDADMIEREFQYSFKQLMWFINKALGLPEEDITFTFNRNIIVNESGIITNIRTSDGIVSRETLLAHHPYVDDVQEELDRIKKEEQEDLEMQEQYIELTAGSNQAGKNNP